MLEMTPTTNWANDRRMKWVSSFTQCCSKLVAKLLYAQHSAYVVAVSHFQSTVIYTVSVSSPIIFKLQNYQKL